MNIFVHCYKILLRNNSHESKWGFGTMMVGTLNDSMFFILQKVLIKHCFSLHKITQNLPLLQIFCQEKLSTQSNMPTLTTIPHSWQPKSQLANNRFCVIYVI